MPLELTKKAGPLPVWGWAVVVAVGGYVLYKRFAGGGGGSSAQNAVSPGEVAQGGTAGSIPVYLSPTAPGSTPTGTDPGTVPAGYIAEAGNFAYNLAHGLVPGVIQGGDWGSPTHRPAAATGGYEIPGYPGVYANVITGIVEYTNKANADKFMQSLGTPASLPIGDLYGTVGYGSQQQAAAGGYWGPGGWVATPTPWNPLPGQPPSGNLAPGTPYITGSGSGNPLPAPGSGGTTPGVPASFQSLASVLSGH